jgi:acyl carrier protein
MEKITTDELLRQVREVVSAETGMELSNVKPDSILRDLTDDSLDMLSLMLELEEQFSINVEREDVGKILTVQNVVDFIEARK